MGLVCSIKVIDTCIWRSSWHVSTTWHSTAWHSTTWHTAHASWGTTSSLVDSHHDWIKLSFQFFLFGFKL
jgi:hypothetical protein